ncbi:hypothetical protein ACHAPE_010345 [Trichoderma viride]
MSLQGKVIVITGGSQGMGKAAALRAASEGASVVFSYNASVKAANDLVQAIGEGRSIAIQADASKLEDNEKLIKAAVDKFGKIDVIYANAGSMPNDNLERTTPQKFDDAIDLLVKGPYFLAQASVPHMPDGGRIIFVTTGITTFSSVTPNYLLYATCKGAIEQMTRVMAKDLAPKGIRVNALGPGPTATEFFFRGKTDQVIEAIKKGNPFGRLGEVEEIADVFMFLCSKQSSWVNGQCLLANGGAMV